MAILQQDLHFLTSLQMRDMAAASLFFCFLIFTQFCLSLSPVSVSSLYLLSGFCRHCSFWHRSSNKKNSKGKRKNIIKFSCGKIIYLYVWERGGEGGRRGETQSQIVWGVCVQHHVCRGQRTILCICFSLSTFSWILGIELSLSSFLSKHHYLLGHLTSLPVFSFFFCNTLLLIVLT